MRSSESVSRHNRQVIIHPRHKQVIIRLKRLRHRHQDRPESPRHEKPVVIVRHKRTSRRTQDRQRNLPHRARLRDREIRHRSKLRILQADRQRRQRRPIRDTDRLSSLPGAAVPRLDEVQPTRRLLLRHPPREVHAQRREYPIAEVPILELIALQPRGHKRSRSRDRRYTRQPILRDRKRPHMNDLARRPIHRHGARSVRIDDRAVIRALRRDARRVQRHDLRQLAASARSSAVRTASASTSERKRSLGRRSSQQDQPES